MRKASKLILCVHIFYRNTSETFFIKITSENVVTQILENENIKIEREYKVNSYKEIKQNNLSFHIFSYFDIHNFFK